MLLQNVLASMFVIFLPFVDIARTFNIDKTNGTFHLFRQKTQPLYGETFSITEKQTFFGYEFFVQLSRHGITESIQLAVGAPTEMIGTYKDSETEEGGTIKEPNPQKRAALSSTDAMGALYYCDTSQEELINRSVLIHECTVRAQVERDISGYEISDKDGLGMSLHTSPLRDDGETIPERNAIVTCAPLRQHDCTTNYKAEGACYISESTAGRGDGQKTIKWNKRIPCRDSCFERDIDLMFVVDGSYSVGNESFRTVKDWIKEVTNGFDITGQVQVGVVQYSYFYPRRVEQQYMKTEIYLGQFKDKKLFDEAVDAIQYHGYSTYTAHAINKTVKEDFNGPTNRYPDARRVMILLTDGYADDAEYLPGATQYAASESVESFAVGVSNYKISQLQLIAGDSGEVITVEDFEDLGNIVSQLQRGIQIMEGAAAPNVNNELTQCEAGIKAYFDKSGALYLGAVGAYDWSGTIVKYDSSSDTDPDIPDFDEVQRVLPNRTKESYLGYSLTSGFFNGKTEREYVAIGAPRYKLEGAVVVYQPRKDNANFTDAFTIVLSDDDAQLGSYFGGSLLSVDLNNDSVDDLLVGAPLYIGGTYDDGRVFVYYSLPKLDPKAWAQRSFTPIQLTAGNVGTGGRFGSAIASAGDLNNDGFNDVIVGAPYVDDNKGAIFVFHGNDRGIDPMYKQVIRASKLPNTKLQYFGLSLQGGHDLDGNEYPDVAIGAPKSDTVVILRSRPVARFTANLSFNTSDVNIFDCFATQNRDCLTIQACLEISGKNIEQTLPIRFKVTMDTGKPRRERIKFQFGLVEMSGERNLTSGVNECWEYVLYVENKISDYSTSIQAKFEYGLLDSHTSIPLSSLTDPSIPNVAVADTRFARNCGGDSICDYDLSVSSSTLTLPPATLTLGNDVVDLTNGGRFLVVSQQTAKRPINVRVNLTNMGEHAFDVRVTISYSYQLNWNNLGVLASSNSDPGDCVVQDNSDPQSRPFKSTNLNYHYNSNLGSIMPANQWCYFEFNVSSNNLSDSGLISDVQVFVTAYTETSVDKLNPNNYRWNETVEIRYRADATPSEKSPQTTVPFNFTTTNDTIESVRQIGANTSDIQISYEVRGNDGYSNIPRSSIDLKFPFSLPGGYRQHLLYLYKYSCIAVEGSAGCRCSDAAVNPYKLLEGFPTVNDTNLPNITIISNPNTIKKPRIFDCTANGNETDGVCEMISCNVTDLGPQDVISFTASFRLWSHSLNLVNGSNVTFLSGFRYSTEGSTLLINKNAKNATIFTSTFRTTARLYRPPAMIEEANNLWIYIVAAIVGLLLLIIIILILWKTGFFKSKYAEKKEQLEWTEANAGTNGEGDANSTADMVNT